MAMKRNNDGVIDAIIGAIEESGRDIAGYQAGGINRRTFYRWIQDDESFRSRVENARRHYKDHSLPEMRKMCFKGLSRTLKAVSEGLEIVTSQTTDAINPRTGEVHTLETIHRKPAMVPIQQAFQYVMGKEFNLVRWVQEGLEEGIIPRVVAEDILNEVNGTRVRIRTLLENGIAHGKGRANRNPGIDPSIAIAAALGLTDVISSPTHDPSNLFQETI
jgi:hypothetical protein